MNASPPESTPRVHRRWLRSAALCGLLIALVLLYHGCARTLVRMEEKRTHRDPATGIALGAEERTLGPEDAPGAVLFVHGFVGGTNNFAHVPEAVAEQGWHVRMMRLPGHGTSPRDFMHTTPEEMLDAVRAELKALRERYPRVVLVSHSMGGSLCTIVAAETPVEGLVLGAPYFGVTYHWYYLLPVEKWARLTAPVLPYVYKGNLFLQVNRKESKPNIYSYAWIPSGGTKALLELGRHAAQPELLEKIHCPVLLLHAPGDVAASYPKAVEAVGLIDSESKQTVELPRSNHHIFWDYDYVAVEQAILAFLAALPGTPASP